MLKKIVEKVPDEVVKTDLERYRQYALELGADDAKIITTDQIVIDERAAQKCRYPICPNYGTHANCPPYAEPIEETRRTVKCYKYAIIFTIKIPSSEIAGPDVGKRRAPAPFLRKMFEIIGKLEVKAFSDGYYYALGYAPGPCKAVFCPDVECSVLQQKPCRAALQARSEGTGLDMYLTATKVGWDIYPCNRAITPDSIPHGRFVSLVLIY